MLKFAFVIATAMLSYLYYNTNFYLCANCVFEYKAKKRIYVITYLINYSFFFFVSIIGTHLIVNWTIFLLFVFLEILIIYRCSWKIGIFMALICTMVSLSLNIFFRCSIAIIINRPLSVFDNHVANAGNIKQYPLLLCFLLTGFFFWYLRKAGYTKIFQHYIEDKEILNFYTFMLSILYGFLILNLLAYYTQGNNLFTKLWGIKSVLLVIFFLYVGYHYTLRMSQIKQSRRDFIQAQQALLNSQKVEDKIRLLAFTDPLTGYYNRQFAEEFFDSFKPNVVRLVVCFVDLDGLKLVNDRMGHPAGDMYIAKTAELLKKAFYLDQHIFIRFGGDEFLIIINQTSMEEAETKMNSVLNEIKKAGAEEHCKYSISYGIADSQETEKIRDIVDLADQRMYQCKKRNKLNR